MSMEYIQSTGDFYINGSRVYTGFSGAPGYINNPAAQCEPDKGPLPRGCYIMTDGESSVTANSIRLEQFLKSVKRFSRLKIAVKTKD